ncbi:MAG: Xaa-Pro peptidase family protein [Leptolinea sp.]
MFLSRLEKFDNLLLQNAFSGAVLNPGASLTYLTGLSFHLMERPVIFFYLPGKKPVMVLPDLEKAKLEALPYEITTFFYGDNPLKWASAFSKAASFLNLIGNKLAVEPTRLRFLELEYLNEYAPSITFVSGSAVFDTLRLRKDEAEIAAMQKAVEIAQKSFLALLPQIRVGKSEKELASELTAQLLKFGSDPELPFQVILSSGPNSANPHAVPGDRVLQTGDLVVVDWGASYQGYASDLTRTLVLGKPSDQQKSIATAALQANTAGRAAGKPGIAAGDVDRAARKEIDNAGYGKFFTHRTGHGLGMEAHETPYMFAENTQILEPGMVYTVEPGIYLPGDGGVRIEDDVVVTSTGSKSLSDLPRELYVIL